MTARSKKPRRGLAGFSGATGDRRRGRGWWSSYAKRSVDGRFVTAEPLPYDIDLVLVLSAQQDLSGDLSPALYT